MLSCFNDSGLKRIFTLRDLYSAAFLFSSDNIIIWLLTHFVFMVILIIKCISEIPKGGLGEECSVQNCKFQ